MMVADKARRCFPVALRCLPTYLDVLHVNHTRNLYVHNDSLTQIGIPRGPSTLLNWQPHFGPPTLVR
jgi:hypothetical protein